MAYAVQAHYLCVMIGESVNVRMYGVSNIFVKILSLLEDVVLVIC
jgi:hypothetical protein